MLPQWITDLPKNQNENNIPSSPPPPLPKKKRVLPRWITDLPKKKGGGVVKQLKSNSKQNKKNTNLENIKKSLSTNEKKQLINSIYKIPRNKLPPNIKNKNKKKHIQKNIKKSDPHSNKNEDDNLSNIETNSPGKKINIVPSRSIKRKIVSRASGHSPSVHNPESEYDLFSPDYINPVRKLKKNCKKRSITRI